MKLIKLTQGKFAQVDDEDFEKLNKYKWHAQKDGNTFYAVRKSLIKASIDGGRKKVHMHRVILGAPPGVLCDHIDGDGLNNQRCNLRIATRQENRRNQIRARKDNKLGVKGVCWNKDHGKFEAGIGIDGKLTHLGDFFCLEKAKKAYREAELKYFGEFARKVAT